MKFSTYKVYWNEPGRTMSEECPTRFLALVKVWCLRYDKVAYDIKIRKIEHIV